MTHLFDRLHEAKQRLAPVQSKYRVVFENPDDPDACACVLVPDPNWLAAALAGGVLPPIDAYLRDQQKMLDWCAENDHSQFAWSKVGGAEHPYANPIGPMTEEEAIEYLIQKDIPPHVWRDYKGNRCIMRIVPVHMIPSDRSFRNSWRVSQEPDAQKEAA